MIESIRAGAVRAGRAPEDILFFQGLSCIVDDTETEARRREAKYDALLSIPALLAQWNIGTSPETGKPLPPDTPLSSIRTNGVQSHIEWLSRAVPGREPTVADLAELVARRHLRLVGTPEQIADRLAEWAQAGINGINLTSWTIPGSFAEFGEHVMPVLRCRRLAKTEAPEGSFRAQLFGTDRLNPRHPASRWRNAFRQG